MRLLVRSLIIIIVVSALCSFFNSTFKGVKMARLTHANYDSTMAAMNFTPSLQQLVSMGAEIGLPEWYMIMLIGTTEGEGYIYDYYLNYEWACTVLNYVLESYDTNWNDKTYVYNTMYGWDGGVGDENYYSEYRVTQRYYNCTADNRKVVYLAMMNRDRNTRACSGDYYDSGYYAYYTSAQYPAISVWYLTGAAIVEDSGVVPGGGTISFTERTSSPAGTFNPCYMTNLYGASWTGHWNTCIYGDYHGSPVVGADVLANCTGYAQGRVLEIYNECMEYNPAQTGTHPFTGLNGNAREWYPLAPSLGLSVSTDPAPGAIICWTEGTDPDSVFGHVGVVERVEDQNTIITTESGYGAIAGQEWISQTRILSGGNWLGNLATMGGYTFQGFILNPASPGPPVPPTPTPGKSKSKIIYQRNWNNYTFRRLLG